MNYLQLSAPFNAAAIKWRVGATNQAKDKGIALAYLDARDVMDRLDAVCNPQNWQCRYPFAGCCEIGIKIDNEWIWKANGAGQSDIEAEKGQFSDAFKRAAVLWGVGRYLYDLPNTWFPIESHGRSHRFTKAAEAEMTQRLADWQAKYFDGGADPKPFNNGANDETAPLWAPASQRKHYSTELQRLWGTKDAVGFRQLWDELTQDQKADIWSDFNSVQRKEMKELLKETGNE